MVKMVIKLLMCFMLSVLVVPVHAETKAELDEVQEVFLNQYYKNQLLVDSKNFVHANYVKKLRNDKAMFIALEFGKRIANVGGQPDVDDYVKTLVTMLSLYDSINEFDVQKQREHDDLKDFRSYMLDATEIATDIMGLIAPGSDMPDLSDALLVAINVLNNSAHVVNDLADSYIKLETIMQDYGSYRRYCL